MRGYTAQHARRVGSMISRRNGDDASDDAFKPQTNKSLKYSSPAVVQQQTATLVRGTSCCVPNFRRMVAASAKPHSSSTTTASTTAVHQYPSYRADFFIYSSS